MCLPFNDDFLDVVDCLIDFLNKKVKTAVSLL